MLPRRKTRLALLVIAGVALLLFATTAELLPHSHTGNSERICPRCHAPALGAALAALRLPSLGDFSWPVAALLLRPVHAASVRLTLARAPPLS